MLENCIKEEFIEKVVEDPYRYAAIYARESNAAIEGPLDAQIYACKVFAQKEGLFVYKSYSEKVSATKKTFKFRPELMRLLQDAEKGYFKTLLVTRRDRLARRFEDFVDIRNECKRLGIEIVYSSDVQLDKDRSYATNFMENILMGLAELEPGRINERVSTGKKLKLDREEFGSRAPFGLKLIKKQKQYVPDVGWKKDLIMSIFNWYLEEDLNEKPLADFVNELIEKAKNIKGTEDRKEYLKMVQGLNNSAIKRRLANPRYAGLHIRPEMGYEDFYIKENGKRKEVCEENFFKAKNITGIVSPADWFKVVNKWYHNNPDPNEKSNKVRKPKHVLEGCYVCTICNKPLNLVDHNFSCKKGCTSIEKEMLVDALFGQVLEVWEKNGDVDSGIARLIEHFEAKIANLKRQIVQGVSKQGLLVGDYIKRPNKQSLKQEIVDLQRSLDLWQEEINKINRKIDFLINEVRNIFVKLAKPEYIHLIRREIENEYELFHAILRFEGCNGVLNIGGTTIRFNGG